MIDVSDGLHDDLGKLLRASGCGARLDVARLPVSPAHRRASGSAGAIIQALTGGDDYELLLTVPANRVPRLLRVAKSWTCPVTRIGTVTSGRQRLWLVDGRRIVVPELTFRHF
jgi:thiamine-monophosphate kinase